MPANIFGERFIGRRVPAWHRIGTTFDEPLSATEAMSRAKLDYTTRKEPLLYGNEPDATLVPNHYAIVRNPTDDDPVDRFFAVASDRYHGMQNMEIAEAVNPLTNVYPVETAGALGYGETMFLSLDAGDSSINGDPIKRYLLLVEHKDTLGSLRLLFTPVRVVCQNTLICGLRAATVSLAIRHELGIQATLDAGVIAIAKAKEQMDNVESVLTSLTDYQMNYKEALGILDAAYPMPKKAKKVEMASDLGMHEAFVALNAKYELACEHMLKLRSSAFDAFVDYNSGQPHPNTPWAMYNAIVENEDHLRETRGESLVTVIGQRAPIKVAAFRAAVALV
jgi:phage/plasmid-like protein (TIGR03299 family)